MKADRQVIRTNNFVTNAANFILEQARKAIGERNEFRIALSGGNTPRPVYSRIATNGHDFPWDSACITFGDERCVAPDDPESNFRMARETLLVPARIPETSVLRMRGEIDPKIAAEEYQGHLVGQIMHAVHDEIEPQIAAQEYQDHVDLLATQRGEPIYRHDLILLGLGDDGHTASLFPGTAAVQETLRRVVANFVPKLSAWRLTLTFRLINAARHICFLIGAGKNLQLIDRVLEGDRQFPAARVNPSAGKVTWIIAE